MSSPNGATLSSHSERPERSRNAKAQARHRAKRKAYIEQLEQTVTKLQTALGFTPEQVAALPPPLVKIKDLEQENARLRKENEEIKRMFQEPDSRGHRSTLPTIQDPRTCDRDLKRRKMANGDDVYMGSASSTPPHELLQRPPPLTIPPHPSHHYGNSSSQHNSHSGGSSSNLFSLHAPAFQMPNTPSGSSSTSSPPFSQPTQMQPATNASANHRPPAIQNHHGLPNYSHSNAHYGHGVKTEDENYASSNQQRSHSAHYPPPPFPTYSHVPPEHGANNWHSYSSERALHR